MFGVLSTVHYYGVTVGMGHEQLDGVLLEGGTDGIGAAVVAAAVVAAAVVVGITGAHVHS